MKKELCVKLVIYKDYTEMHGQQNMKVDVLFLQLRCLILTYLVIEWCRATSILCYVTICCHVTCTMQLSFMA